MEQETLHIFDAYCRGLMAESDRLNFEARLVAEPLLKAELDEYIHIVNGVNEYERERLKSFIKDSKMRSLYAGGGWSSFMRVAAAAAVILVLVIPGYIIFRTTTYPSRLVKEYTMNDPGLPVTMGAASNPMLDQAMIEFKDRQFDAALAKIQQLLAVSPDNDTLNYYAGLCYFETLKNKDAIQFFSKITDNTSTYYLQARYNEGLAYIRDDNNEAAKVSLGIVAGSKAGPLQIQATELLGKI